MKYTLLSFSTFVLQAQAAWYYNEASCGSKSSLHQAYAADLIKMIAHTQILDADGMAKALSLVDLARQGFGGPAPAGSGSIWEFPHDEARDLAGRVFGDALAPLYNPIKSIVIPSMTWYIN
jgi:hypothetical protein